MTNLPEASSLEKPFTPSDTVSSTDLQYRNIIERSLEIFLVKLEAYGPSWRAFRFYSLMDQIFIKAKRIRRLEELGGSGQIPDSIPEEYLGIINYSIIGIDLLRNDGIHHATIANLGTVPERWSNDAAAQSTYFAIVKDAFETQQKKNHDYDEAWREMHISSLTDEILGRVLRIRRLLHKAQSGDTNREVLESQLIDALNYSVFALMKLDEETR